MRQNLAQGRVGVTLLKFAGPFLLASLLQALYGAADLFVVGRFADAAAVSGVSIGSQIMQTLTGVILGLSMGGTVLIGQRVGAVSYTHLDVYKRQVYPHEKSRQMFTLVFCRDTAA